MKANYTPPKGIVQLTYNVSSKEITRLKALDERSKTISEYPFQAVVRVKCGKQSDYNYKKCIRSLYPCIANFTHNGIHVYMKVRCMTRVFSQNLGICYKILVDTIKELPK